MKSYLLAATAVAAIATPAAARDRSAYVGLEVGALFVTDTHVTGNVIGEGVTDVFIDHKMGVDGDLIAGYDFGMFRLEGELGYKRSEHKDYRFGGITDDARGRSSTYSGMVNAMIDLGHDEGFQFYAGAGAGWAQVTHVLSSGGSGGFKIQDRGFAWQGIAGVRYPVSQYFDLGLKYRYFDAGHQNDTNGSVALRSDYKSHSVLLSLIHNFNSPAPPPPPPVVVEPPPPPPPPPATQTCPDGSVILATDACPAPPPPPPPPPPEPVRG